MPLRSFLIFVIVCLIWSSNVVVSKLVIADMGVPPLFYAAMRALVVMVALSPWLRPLPKNLFRVMLVTLAVSGGSFTLLFVGLQYASPASSAVVSLLSAPLTVLFAILILHEKIHWRRGLGIGLVFAGVGVAIAGPASWQGSYGLLFVGLSALVGALGSVFLKQIDMPPINLQAWAGASSALVLFPLTAIAEQGQLAAAMSASWPFLLAVGFSALVVSVGAHTVYFNIVQKYDANIVAPLTLMTPVFTILLGALITGDEVGIFLITGALIAGSGVFIILVRPSAKVFKPLLVRPRL